MARQPTPVTTRWWIGYVLFGILFFADVVVTILSLTTSVLNNRTWMYSEEGQVVNPWLLQFGGTMSPVLLITIMFHIVRLFLAGVVMVQLPKIINEPQALTDLEYAAMGVYPYQFALFLGAILMQLVTTFVVHYAQSPWISSVWLYACQTAFVGGIIVITVIQSFREPLRARGTVASSFLVTANFPSYQSFMLATYWWFPWLLLWVAEAGIRAVVEAYPDTTTPEHIQGVITPVVLACTSFLLGFLAAFTQACGLSGALYAVGVAFYIMSGPSEDVDLMRPALVVAFVVAGCFFLVAVARVLWSTVSMSVADTRAGKDIGLTTQNKRRGLAAVL